MALSCFIIGSDSGTRSRISDFLEQARFFDVKARFSHATEAIARHQASPVHYFLVDLPLAYELLMELQHLREARRPRVIIIGPEETYFLEKIDAHPSLFEHGIHLPSLDPTTLEEGVVIATGHLEVPPTHRESLPPTSRSHKPIWILLRPGDQSHEVGPKRKESFFVRTEGTIRRLRRADLLLIEAEKDYLILITADTRYRVLRSMKSIETKLDPQTHCRIHRSYIVNIENIHTIDQEELWLDHLSTPIPIGPSYRKNLLDKLDIL